MTSNTNQPCLNTTRGEMARPSLTYDIQNFGMEVPTNWKRLAKHVPGRALAPNMRFHYPFAPGRTRSALSFARLGPADAVATQKQKQCTPAYPEATQKTSHDNLPLDINMSGVQGLAWICLLHLGALKTIRLLPLR